MDYILMGIIRNGKYDLHLCGIGFSVLIEKSL